MKSIRPMGLGLAAGLLALAAVGAVLGTRTLRAQAHGTGQESSREGLNAAPPATYTVLYNFGNVSGDPKFSANGAMLQGRDGGIYGDASGGGTFGNGMVYKFTTRER
jgi:hypothetical protein